MTRLADTIRNVLTALDSQNATKGLDFGHPPQLPFFWEPNRDAARARRAVGDGSTNSAVHNVLRTKSAAFAEPPPTVVDVDDNPESQGKPVVNHPFTRLLTQPNPLMVWDFVADYVVWSIELTGQAYLWKRRSTARQPVELWPLISTYVTPKGTSGDLIDFFEYNPTGVPHRIEPEDVIYLRYGLNRKDHRLGDAPIRNVLLEVMTDEEASRYAAYMLTNMGVPGVMILPQDDTITQLEAETIAEDFEDRFTGPNRGKVFVPFGGKVNVETIAFSPEQMDVKQLRRVPEERIAGAAGVPLSLAQLGAGLENNNSLGDGSARQVERQFFTQQTLVPLWRRIERQLTAQLLAEFDPNRRIVFPHDQVAALSEDRNATAERVSRGVEIGAATVADWRRTQGLPVDDTHNIFLRPVSALEVPTTE